MAIPAYMWIKDDGGADVKGSVTSRAAKAVSKWSRSITA